MATDKKSFILYADLFKSIEHLTNEEKGILFNHLLEYVNDRNPILEDRLILTAWKPIELQLKRDLVKFEEVKVKRSEAGKASADARALKTAQQHLTNLTSVESVEHTSTNSTDNVTENVNVNDNDNDKKEEPPKGDNFDFKKSLLNYGFDSTLVGVWLAIRKKKNAHNSKIAFQGFIREVEKSGKDKNEILRRCVEKSWVGFEAAWIVKEKVTPPNMAKMDKDPRFL
jgi:hypothetical protein